MIKKVYFKVIAILVAGVFLFTNTRSYAIDASIETYLRVPMGFSNDKLPKGTKQRGIAERIKAAGFTSHSHSATQSKAEIIEIPVGNTGHPNESNIKLQKTVQKIHFIDTRTLLEEIELEYDALGQLTMLSIVWNREVQSEVTDYSITLDNRRIFHFSYTADAGPRIWIERKDEVPWIFSGFCVQEKIRLDDKELHYEEPYYVTISHYVSDEGTIIAASESIHHDEMCDFVTEQSGELNLSGADVSLINYDHHSDCLSVDYDRVTTANWGTYLKKILKLVSEFIWVTSRGEPWIKPGVVDFVTTTYEIQPTKPYIFITYDFDYFSLGDTAPIVPDEFIPGREDILKRIKDVVLSLDRNIYKEGSKVCGVNFTRSAFSKWHPHGVAPDQSPKDQSNFILNALVSEHQHIFGKAILHKCKIEKIDEISHIAERFLHRKNPCRVVYADTKTETPLQKRGIVSTLYKKWLRAIRSRL